MPENPPVLNARDLSDYLAVLTKAVFKSGLSLATVEAKWEGFLEAFERFDPERVASFTPEKIDELAQDRRIVRARSKIEGTVENARTMLELEKEHGDFRSYLQALGGFEGQVADLKKRFAFVGDASAHWFLASVGEPVPPYAERKRERRGKR